MQAIERCEEALSLEEGIERSAFDGCFTGAIARNDFAEELLDTVEHEQKTYGDCLPSPHPDISKSFAVLVELLPPEAANRIGEARDVTRAVKRNLRQAEQELGRQRFLHSVLTVYCQVQFHVASCCNLASAFK